jgi:hypothetical protein
MDMLAASTKALSSNDPTDAIWTSREASVAALTASRDDLASQIRDALDAGAFAGPPIDPMQLLAWISQAQALLASADALAAAP